MRSKNGPERREYSREEGGGAEQRRTAARRPLRFFAPRAAALRFFFAPRLRRANTELRRVFLYCEYNSRAVVVCASGPSALRSLRRLKWRELLFRFRWGGREPLQSRAETGLSAALTKSRAAAATSLQPGSHVSAAARRHDRAGEGVASQQPRAKSRKPAANSATAQHCSAEPASEQQRECMRRTGRTKIYSSPTPTPGREDQTRSIITSPASAGASPRLAQKPSLAVLASSRAAVRAEEGGGPGKGAAL